MALISLVPPSEWNGQINIIPALQGTYELIYESEDNKIYLGKHIICWSVWTTLPKFAGDAMSVNFVNIATPYTLSGESSISTDKYGFAVLMPDDTVCTNNGSDKMFPSLESFADSLNAKVADVLLAFRNQRRIRIG